MISARALTRWCQRRCPGSRHAALRHEMSRCGKTPGVQQILSTIPFLWSPFRAEHFFWLTQGKPGLNPGLAKFPWPIGPKTGR
jgi:hypothetical protein